MSDTSIFQLASQHNESLFPSTEKTKEFVPPYLQPAKPLTWTEILYKDYQDHAIYRPNIR